MSVYELRTFADLVAAVREECQIQSTDTTAINRIKRDLNILYAQVWGRKRWWWSNRTVDLTLPAYVNAGTASVTQNSASVTLTVAPALSKTGYWFALDGYNEIYKIESHSAGSTTVKLSNIFTGATNSAATYKIWTERVPLPTDCKETVEVWHDNYRKPCDGVGRQEFRRIWNLQPRNEGYPQYYFTGDFNDPAQTSSISSLPAISTRASAGTRKTIVFASSLPSAVTTAITAGDPVVWNISAAGHPSYNGRVNITGFSTTSTANDTVTYTGVSEYQESAISDSTMAITSVDAPQDYDRYRELYIYPALNSSATTLHVEYARVFVPLKNDSDEPYIPLQDRDVLLFGALWKTWKRLRNKEESDSAKEDFGGKLAEMESKFQDSTETAKLEPSKIYLGAKRNLWRKRAMDDFYGPTTAGGGSAGQTVTGTANSAAQFGTDGVLVASPTVSTTELGYLDGAGSSVRGISDTATLTNKSMSGSSNTFTNIPLTTAVTGVLPIANGGTNSSTALTNGFVMKSTGGAIVESSTTTTELTFLTNTEGLTTVALADNQSSAANIATWTVASFNFVELFYCIKRGANFEGGTIVLVSDGSTAAISTAGASVGSSGVTLTADVSGGSLRLRYTSTSTGTAPSFNYKLMKYLAT